MRPINKDQLKKQEADLWRAADSLGANADLKPSEYSTPVLGLIFLKFADNKYRQHEAAILAEYQQRKGGDHEKKLLDIAIERCGFYERLASQARSRYATEGLMPPDGLQERFVEIIEPMYRPLWF